MGAHAAARIVEGGDGGGDGVVVVALLVFCIVTFPAAKWPTHHFQRFSLHRSSRHERSVPSRGAALGSIHSKGASFAAAHSVTTPGPNLYLWRVITGAWSARSSAYR